MTTIFNPTLLKLVRQAMGASQKDFAEKVLGVRQAVLSKYENGVIVPSEEVLWKLEESTSYPRDFYFQEASELPSGLVFHRKRNSLSSKLREGIESEVRLRALDILKICKATSTQSDVIEREDRSPQEMAQALRNAWHLGGEPIQNLVKVLEKHSIVIMKFDFKTDKLDAFFMPLPCNVICIALNANPAFSADRQNFSLAHELGHALMHQEQVQDDSLEKEADAFASEFLFPAQAVEEEYKAGLSFSLLKALKQKWRISMQAILFRGHKLKWIDDKTYRRFYIYFSSQGLRKHEPPCGVENDQPTLLNNLMKEYMQMPGSVLKKLHLSSRCFSMRYPEIQQGGKST